MQNVAETILKFKIAQLEGRLAIYESLMSEISRLDSMEKAVSNVKLSLEGVTDAWDKHLLARSSESDG